MVSLSIFILAFVMVRSLLSQGGSVVPHTTVATTTLGGYSKSAGYLNRATRLF